MSFTKPQPELQRQQGGAAVGLDIGISSTVTTLDGVKVRMPKLLTPGEAKRKQRLQRKLSRQNKDSNRRATTSAH